MSPWIWGALVGGAAALVLLPARAQAQPPLVGNAAERIAAVRALAAQAGLPAAWGDFFALVAWNESKGYPTAYNDRASEAAAAKTAFERNEHRYVDCGHPEAAYTRGSGGLFGIIPANGLAQLGDEHECLHPDTVTDPRVALAMAVGMARGLMGWQKFKKKPTWLNLRTMWGAPNKGGDSSYLAKVRPHFVEDAAAVGLPPSWLDKTPPPLPVSARQVLQRLHAA